eukprot:GFUD01039311.1.p1 GENE.GFUD01039311.1~~GFUD01039311.1.p1  ORF type:complete len:469 (+),score=105.62 GFUD01039311.1:88-1494(+)
MSSDQLNLKWKSFENNLSSSLKEFRDSCDFYDVTLACGSDQIQCHKLVLSACSPFFLRLLRRNPHPHPLLYLTGIAFKHLLSVLDFMYNGQVDVSQEDLLNFMAIAEELKVKGLFQVQPAVDDAKEASSPVRKEHSPVHVQRPSKVKSVPHFQSSQSFENPQRNLDQEYNFSPVKTSTVVHSSPPPPIQSLSLGTDIPIISDPRTLQPPTFFLPKNPFSVPNLENILSMVKHPFSNQHNFPPSFRYLLGDKENNLTEGNEEGVDPVESIEKNEFQFREKCKSMIQKRKDGSYQCLVCKYNNVKKNSVRRHVQSHVPSVRHACNFCNRSFKNKNSLSSHRSTKHKVVTKEQQVVLDDRKVLLKEDEKTNQLEEVMSADVEVPQLDHNDSNVSTQVAPVAKDLQCAAAEVPDNRTEQGSIQTHDSAVGQFQVTASEIVKLKGQKDGSKAYVKDLGVSRDIVKIERIDPAE